ncbi:hypothetical protein NDU88_004143 [Pleurodeles waltl]|uniref:Uncharacterized protein n=1 Tax=Pleurodeles waltl TaxID=8319 RepID=A0AAV7QBE3_PLEWA|nr:hypothetical protein NDU88_004143 [Pleurodeles waltl]
MGRGLLLCGRYEDAGLNILFHIMTLFNIGDTFFYVTFYLWPDIVMAKHFEQHIEDLDVCSWADEATAISVKIQKTEDKSRVALVLDPFPTGKKAEVTALGFAFKYR